MKGFQKKDWNWTTISIPEMITKTNSWQAAIGEMLTMKVQFALIKVELNEK